MKNWRESVLLAAFALGGCTASTMLPPAKSGASSDGKTIFVTRHMQKAEGNDPPLSREGAVSAERLADILADENVSAIFATSTRRAMETAAPLSNRTGMAVTAYDPRDPQLLVTAVAASKGSVLIVGHSNTVHDLIERLGGQPPIQLADDDYGRVFVIDAKGNVREFKVS